MTRIVPCPVMLGPSRMHQQEVGAKQSNVCACAMVVCTFGARMLVAKQLQLDLVRLTALSVQDLRAANTALAQELVREKQEHDQVLC